MYEINDIKKTSGISETSLNWPTGLSIDKIPQSNNNVNSDTSPTKYSMQENANNTQKLDNGSFLFQKDTNNSIKQQDKLIREVYPNYKPGITDISSNLVANNLDVINYNTNYSNMSDKQLGISNKEKIVL